MANSIICQQIW